MSRSRMAAVAAMAVFIAAGCASGAPADRREDVVVAGSLPPGATGGLGGAGGQAGSAGAIGTGAAGSAGASGARAGSGGAGGSAGMAGLGGAGAGGSAGSARGGSSGMDAGRGGAAGSSSAGTGGAAPDSDCDAATFEGHAYWFCADNADWDDARAMCQEAGGDLVSIGSQAEQDFVAAQADGGVWLIGLDQKNASGGSTAGSWEWSDGSDLAAFDNWGSGEPDDAECGALDGSSWVDRSCTNDTNYICEVPEP